MIIVVHVLHDYSCACAPRLLLCMCSTIIFVHVLHDYCCECAPRLFLCMCSTSPYIWRCGVLHYCACAFVTNAIVLIADCFCCTLTEIVVVCIRMHAKQLLHNQISLLYVTHAYGGIPSPCNNLIVAAVQSLATKGNGKWRI